MNDLEYIPRLEVNGNSIPMNSTCDDSREIVLFIDYTSKNTKISYTDAQPGQVPNSANVKRITDWPGQSLLDKVFPTVEVILLPGFKNNVNGNTGKRIISLKENSNHDELFLKQTEGGQIGCIYHTFKKCKRDIILFTHRQEMTRDEFILLDDVEKLQTAQYTLGACANKTVSIPSTSIDSSSPPRKYLSSGRNSDLRTFTVTQQRISFKNFSVMYFEYLTSFLFDYIHSKIGTKDVKFRYCITRDSCNEPFEFRLTEKDIYDIAVKCGMLSKEIDDSYQALFVLERAEATALYCRDLIGTIDTNNCAEDTSFIQLQLNADQFLLLLNQIPCYDGRGSNAQFKKQWRGIHKYAKSKNIPFNFMNTVCQNLWIYVQKFQKNLLKKCDKHSSSKRFFDASNMHVFNELLLIYLSTANLELIDDEKVHNISICRREGDCCHVRIANMDLAQFGFIPAMNKLVSKVQSIISNQYFHMGLHISNIFIMGSFLCCQSQTDYKVLEDMLLMDLSKVSFTRSNDKKKNAQITKVEEHSQTYDNENDQNSLADFALKCSIMYGINSNNRLVERFSTKSYAIKFELCDSSWNALNGESTNSDGVGYTDIDDDNPIGDTSPGNFDARNISIGELDDAANIESANESVVHKRSDRHRGEPLHGSTAPYAIWNQSNFQTKVDNTMLIPIIRKGTALASLELIEETINASFTIFNCSEHININIEIYMLEEDVGDNWKRITPNTLRYISTFFKITCRNLTYPIIFKTRLSQTRSYTCWVEYNGNDRDYTSVIKERVSLKTNHSRQCKTI